jgi:hypothetical protein
MATKRSSFFLAVLLIANPFMLLFYQNCSAVPIFPRQNLREAPAKGHLKSPASEAKGQTDRDSDK